MSTVTIIMGSKSDLPALKGAFDTLKEFGVDCEGRILSAHRTPDAAAELAKNAEENGTKVLICAAGMAAHLAGVIAGHTVLPVIGIPMASAPFNGLDSLLAMVQMPPGIPVATVTAGNAGGKNAALLAIQMLALSDPELMQKLKDFRVKQAEKVLADDKVLRESGYSALI
ncbi:MAG: 5-(carboxyamino)imidazole ribonucleotide mutase [Lentisphaeria bacterium]|nr:5-(carboxyamino)imidazole ribonucleotide mutase [Lentisphaerota bacterium]MBO5695737.1 5-(carboxyamino)imidazole ribonucleotide mutase [Lentisphaeria bacterium]MBO5802445.1 5-(carboxyamino)imidazole ribonucleotide mutase [Lentisphaeria bacterium]